VPGTPALVRRSALVAALTAATLVGATSGAAASARLGPPGEPPRRTAGCSLRLFCSGIFANPSAADLRPPQRDGFCGDTGRIGSQDLCAV
jgi:hypothetical protein